MTHNDLPESRRVLFVNQAEGMLIDPQMVPFAMTTAPYEPATLGAHNPYSKLYMPRDYVALPVADEEFEPGPLGRWVRGYFDSLRARWGRPTATLTPETGTGPGDPGSSR